MRRMSRLTGSAVTAALACAVATLPALAHTPHDSNLFVTSWPGSDDTPVLTTIFRNSGTLLARYNGPQDVDVRLLARQTAQTWSATLVGPTTLLVSAGDEGLWISDDLWDSWSVHPDLSESTWVEAVLASPDVHNDGIALVATAEGIWRTDDGGGSFTMVAETGNSVERIAYSPLFADDGRACALIGETTIMCSEDKGLTWSRLGLAPATGVGLAVGPSGTVWVGTPNGLTKTVDGNTWLPQTALGTEEVSEVAVLSDGVVLAAEPEEAVWRTGDNGDTWTLQTNDLPATLNGIGAPQDGLYFRQFLEHPDGRVHLATWSGLYESNDRGFSWTKIQIEMPWVTRSLDMTYSDDGAPWVLLGKYGAGATRLRADGTEIDSVCADYPPRHLRSVSIGPGNGEAQAVFAVNFSSVGSSLDGGKTWTVVEGEDWYELGHIDVEEVVTDNPRVILAGDVVNASIFAHSDDGGASWAASTFDRTCIGGRKTLDIPDDWSDEATAWAGCRTDGNMYISRDRGDTWSFLANFSGEWVFSVKGIPGADAVMVGTDQGLYRMESDASYVQLAFDGHQVSSVAVSPEWATDGTAFAVVGTQGWFRTTDFGDTWDELDRPTQAHAEMIAVSPKFGSDDTVTAGTYDGAWASPDRGDTWINITGVDRLEETNTMWTWGDGWVEVEDDDASADKYYEASLPGATGQMGFLGVGFDLIGRVSETGGALTLTLDGEELATVEQSAGVAEDRVVLYSVRDLAYTQHVLEVTAASAPANVDAVLAWHQDETVDTGSDTGTMTDSGTTDSVPTDDTGTGPTDSGPGDSGGGPEDCGGCSSGGTAPSAWFLGLFGLVAVRLRAQSPGRPGAGCSR